MGPGTSCTRMIDAMLEGRPHLARSACIAGQDAVGTVLRMLASLIAERIPTDLKSLYGAATSDRIDTGKPLSRGLVIRVGREPVQVAPLPVAVLHAAKASSPQVADFAVAVPERMPEEAVALDDAEYELVNQVGATNTAGAEA